MYDILGTDFVFPLTLGKFDPQQWFDHQNIKN